jgi:hypothetical protein
VQLAGHRVGRKKLDGRNRLNHDGLLIWQIRENPKTKGNWVIWKTPNGRAKRDPLPLRRSFTVGYRAHHGDVRWDFAIKGI